MSEQEESLILVKFYKFVLVYSSLKGVNPHEGGWGEN